jgi:hypothetical protein
MARFACIRVEVEKRRAEVAMGGNDKVRILDLVDLALTISTESTPRDAATTTTVPVTSPKLERSRYH